MDFATLVLASDTRGLRDGQKELRNLSGEGERAEKRVSGASRMMSNSFRTLALGAAAAAGAIAGTVLSGRMFSAAIRESEQLERNLLRMNAVVRATGSAAGRTATQLHEQARAMAAATLASTEGIMEAQTTLLTFRNVQGEVFDRAIEASLDMAEALGQDVRGAVMQLGKALEDPIRGMTALSRSGTVFTDAQREMVKELVEAGNAAEAQRFILSELEAQYGGTARAAADGLGGSFDSLKQAGQELLLALGEAGLISAARWLVDALTGLANGAAILIGQFSELYSATRSLFSEKERTKRAVDDLASAIEDERRAINDLTPALAAGNAMSVDAARTKLQEAGARRENIQAIIDEHNALMRLTPEYKSLSREIDYVMMQSSNLRNTGRDGGQFAPNANRADLEFHTRRLTELAGERQALLAATDDQTDALRRNQQQIDALTSGLAAATDGTVTFTDAAGEMNDQLEGIGGGGGGSARAAAVAVDELSNSMERADHTSQQLESAFESAFVGFVTGANSAKEAAGQLLQQLSRMLANQAFQSLFGGMFGGGGGGLLGGLFGGMRSFEGGGFTGSGPRTGGLDGRGGQLAMLHPNETVIDHTRGQSGGQSVVRVELSPELIGQILGQAHGQSLQIVRTETPRMIGGAFQRARETRAFD